MTTASARTLGLVTAGFTIALLLWDASGLDVALARASGGPTGFALRENWLLTHVLHDGGRRLAWTLALGLCLAAWWPVGVLASIGFNRRLQFAVTTLLAVAAVSALKSVSGTSCPWDLAEFGGVARYTSHWAQLLQPDGGSGRCFPAGHASSGFAFIGGYFAFRHANPAWARFCLGAALAAGLALGVAQQLRGAHFMSHTLWSGWLCWCVAWAVDAGWGRLVLGDAPAMADQQS